MKDIYSRRLGTTADELYVSLGVSLHAPVSLCLYLTISLSPSLFLCAANPSEGSPHKWVIWCCLKCDWVVWWSDWGKMGPGQRIDVCRYRYHKSATQRLVTRTDGRIVYYKRNDGLFIGRKRKLRIELGDILRRTSAAPIKYVRYVSMKTTTLS